MENTEIVKYEIINNLPDQSTVSKLLDTIKQFQETVNTHLIKEVDYGVVGGGKPSLFKSGAEKIIMLLGLRSSFDIIEKLEDHNNAYFYYNIKCSLIKNGEVITEGLGSANSKEGRYILKGNKDDETQRTYSFTIANTVLKMAKKRAMVDAVLIVASLSNIFTQDIEEMEEISEMKKSNNYNKSNTQYTKTNDEETDFYCEYHLYKNHCEEWKELKMGIHYSGTPTLYKIKTQYFEQFKAKYGNIISLEPLSKEKPEVKKEVKKIDYSSKTNEEILHLIATELVRNKDLDRTFIKNLKATNFQESFYKYMFSEHDVNKMDKSILIETLEDLKANKKSMIAHIQEFYKGKEK